MSIKDLGEVALRVRDLRSMRQFYEKVIGLRVWRKLENPPAIFYKLAEGYRDHTHFLALFERSASPDYQGLDPDMTTVDHIALEIPLSDYEKEQNRLRGLGVRVVTKEFPSFH